VKLAVVGAGSTYTPELVDGLIRMRDLLPVEELTLLDSDEVPPLDAVTRGLVAHVSAYEELALDAALQGGRERVFRALLAHPLIGQQRQAELLTDLLIDANRRYLPWA
jgi:alpha-galactosidase/6-phospho-beta-glucosidase family protein